MSLMSWLCYFGLMCGVSKTLTFENLQLAFDLTGLFPLYESLLILAVPR